MPRLDDDGQTVTLDLHGATVDEALRLAERTVQRAAARGRAQVRLIHGHSTSRRDYANRTIKHALHDWFDTAPGSAPNILRKEGEAVISLDLSLRSDPRRLTLRDVQP